MSDAPQASEPEPDDARWPEPTALLIEFLSAQGHVSPIAAVTEWLRMQYTPAGRLLLCVFVVALIVSGSLNTSFAVHLFTFGLIVTLALSWVLGLLARPRVTVEREIPARVAAGSRFIVRARVKNVGRLPILDLTVAERPSSPRVLTSGALEYARVLEPGKEVELGYTLEARRRGSYDFEGPVAMTAFPFGLEHTKRKLSAPQRLLVYPRFAKLTALDLPVSRKHQPGGLQLVSLVGDSGEFVGAREWRDGDRVRDVHHAAWARLGYPVVREFHEEYLCRIALVLDTHVPRWRQAERARLEAAISLGAAVAEVLSRQEYVIDIFAAGPDLYHFEAGRSLAYLDNILDILACIDGSERNPFDTLAPAIAEELGRISTCVVVLLEWDEARLRFVRSLEEAGVVTKVIVVNEGKLTSDPTGYTTGSGPIQVLTPAQVGAGVDRL